MATTPAANRDGSSPPLPVAAEISPARSRPPGPSPSTAASATASNSSSTVVASSRAVSPPGRSASSPSPPSISAPLSAMRPSYLAIPWTGPSSGPPTTEEEILRKVESTIQENNSNRSYTNGLLALIADSVGISKNRTALKKGFKEVAAEAKLQKDLAEAIQWRRTADR
ncbi:predicted GPI-anchored protein 58 [Musa acuminata AAA Group]|uniref:predicted GPI-anchored protein 58 n=1 Tax=Musa acuminata AAA Group TaxID=214697 RepID=UPI0031E37F39